MWDLPRRAVSSATVTTFFVAFCGACSAESTAGEGQTAVGGRPSLLSVGGGTNEFGSTPPNAGNTTGGSTASSLVPTNTGGVSSIDGSTTAGGTLSHGTMRTSGTVISGGTANTGGTASTGGSVGNGGLTAKGGSTSIGGATNSGGTKNTGGMSSGGGSSTSSTVPTGLPASCSGNCDAATPANPSTTAYGTLGNVTVYSTSASNGGACNYGNTGVLYYAAINTFLEWQGGHVCGQCMLVTLLTTEGEKSVVVRIMDKCPDGNCGIDLGGASSGKVMVNGAGRYHGAWRPVSCVGQAGVSDGAPNLWVKDGASLGWSIVQIRNPNAAVVSMDWQNVGSPSSKGTLPWATEAENFFSIPASILSANASFLFTIHYGDGTTGTVTLTSSQLGKPSTEYPLN